MLERTEGPKPTVAKANEMKMGSCPQDEVLQTPVTPVSAEALTSLHNLIKQDAHTLNETSVQRLQRHVQKLANAAQISFAERALLRDQNHFLTRMNNEAKVRRSTKSRRYGDIRVQGRSKSLDFRVTHCEPEPEPEVARAAKEVINGRGKRGRKRKSAVLEADEPEPEPEVAQMIEAPELWRASVVRMI
ncbi:hypothetical protein B0J14DRAFT_567159 [Halenospora varia]|nr:hypothetical protein B0J14DRAFT_567159 [Halenospora varia]